MMQQYGLFASTVKSTWRPTPVAQLPSWAGVKRIGLDIETRDPDLKELGPGVRRGAKIIGVSFQIEDGPGHYLPVGHVEDNLDPAHVFGYLKDQFKEFDGDVVGANLPYDLDFLWEAGVKMPKVKRFRDIQVADPLIDELQMSYSLDNVAKRHGLEGKREHLLRLASEAYRVDAKKGMWQLPARFVGEYAIGDTDLPLKILRKQERIIDEQDLWKIYDLETRLTPVLLKLRRRGVAVDLKHLQYIEDWTREQQSLEVEKIRVATGVRLSIEDVNRPAALVPVLKAVGITDIPTTAKTNKPSIDKFFLERHKHAVTASILRARKMDKVRGTFCNSIRAHVVNGRIHCTFNQMRRSSDSEGDDDTGARYGRLSCTDPNLQQQPARDPEIGKLWRKVYIPNDGEIWAAKDYSQQEPRLTYQYAFLAKCTGADAMIKRFNDDPNADSHTEMAKMCYAAEDLADKGKFKQLRGYAKEIFLGITYGMGGAKLCRKLGKPTKWKYVEKMGKSIEIAGEEGQAIMDNVDRKMPFLRQLAKMCENAAKTRGWVRTIMGRVCHFPLKEDGKTFDWCHKALNRVVQGSAADQTKLAVVSIDEAGFTGMQLQVHDEIDSSVKNPEEAEAMANIMRTCLPLALPSKVDVELGKSWGDSM